MYLLYLDESGNENDPNDRYFVLAGLALFERQTFFLTKDIEAIQDKHFPNKPPIPFHASEIRSGRNLWRRVDNTKRTEVLTDLSTAIMQSPARGRFLFAAAVEKTRDLYGEAAVARATEEICRRFDTLLQRRFQREGDAQRGLIIFSEGRFDARAKIWVRGFHQRGTQWGAINNLADIPYFAPMHESRLLQAADLIAHATWLLYERRDPTLIRSLLPAFETPDGVPHGLVHVKASSTVACDCPACCVGRQSGPVTSPWISPAP
jgi:hypothetical protein